MSIETKEVIVAAPVTASAREQLDQVARAERRSRAAVIRLAIEEYIERHEAEAKAAAA